LGVIVASGVDASAARLHGVKQGLARPARCKQDQEIVHACAFAQLRQFRTINRCDHIDRLAELAGALRNRVLLELLIVRVRQALDH
jgi:hypothetical protein